jgi:protein-tyrosine phosphatase
MEPYPDFGVYLATQWKLDLGMYWTNGAYVKRIAQNRPYPAIIVDVPDMKAPPVAVLNTLVEIIVSKMKQGKLVDIGCIAGHGRTGTLLACLIARKEHLDGRAAIAAARERYCPMAVENREQEQAVSEYVNLYLRNRR